MYYKGNKCLHAGKLTQDIECDFGYKGIFHEKNNKRNLSAVNHIQRQLPSNRLDFVIRKIEFYGGLYRSL